MQELRPRLKAAAAMVRGGRVVADIGTDHAYLPAYLLLNGIVPRVIACDIGERPLANAAETVRIYRLRDRIDLRVSDGLQNVRPEEYNEVTVCGMGGTLIAQILEQSSLPQDVRLVLQPMTHIEDVRAWLCRNGFAVCGEVCVKEAGRVYCCLAAERGDEPLKDEPGYWYFGSLTGETEEERLFLRKTRDRVKKRVESLAAVNRFPEEQTLLRQALSYYETNYEDDCKRSVSVS